jgi:hypothetical protein
MHTRFIRRLLLGFAVLAVVAGFSSAPASATPPGYVSFRPIFSPQNALQLSFLGPPTIQAHDPTFGFTDWRIENTINGFRLRNRIHEEAGNNLCLAGGGTQVWEETCATSPAKLSQNWSLASVSGGFRLRHGSTGSFVTYPAFGRTGPVSLAGSGSLATQQFVFGA